MHTLNSEMDHSIKDSPRDWDLTNIMFQHGKQNDWLYDVLQELQGLRNERKDLQNELERANKAAQIAEEDLEAIKAGLFKSYGLLQNELQNTYNTLGKHISSVRAEVVDISQTVENIEND